MGHSMSSTMMSSLPKADKRPFVDDSSSSKTVSLLNNAYKVFAICFEGLVSSFIHTDFCTLYEVQLWLPHH